MRHPFPFSKNMREPNKGENVLTFVIDNNDLEHYVELGKGIYIEYDNIEDEDVKLLKAFKEPEVIKTRESEFFFYFTIAEKIN